jgi:hypothetical protein
MLGHHVHPGVAGAFDARAWVIQAKGIEVSELRREILI